MNQALTKTRSRKGFTLAELLIVVAIIAVLVAIAVPVFTSALTKAETAVTDANFRAAKSAAMVKYLTSDPIPTEPQAYGYSVDAFGNITLSTSSSTSEGATDKTTGIVIIQAGS